MTKIGSVHNSAVETTHLVLPPDTNAHGTAFGGKIMQWMDIAASICAGRHCKGPVVTAAVDHLVFNSPIRMGHVVIIRAHLNYTGRSSMEVEVSVDSEDPLTGNLESRLDGYFTFVAVDDCGKPIPAPPLQPESEAEKERFAAGAARQNLRSAQRS